MSARARRSQSRRWLVPEVVQTSAMDCGPAALKCALEGFGTPVSYGRLREACQTDVDGSSIDTIEEVARQLGLAAQQEIIPADHLVLASAAALPCIAVVRHAELATHFVVVWRRTGDWLQVMDPARGRRWTSVAAFEEELFRHEQPAPAADWRAWAGSPEFTRPLAERMARLGLSRGGAQRLIADALADPGWFPIGALDAVTRLTTSLVAAGAVRAGREAHHLLSALFRDTCGNGGDIYALVAPDYWSVVPDDTNTDWDHERLRVRGVVLVTLGAGAPGEREDLSLELQAALAEKAPPPLATLLGMLREDGMLAPLALAGAMTIATCALMVEALLFRGVFDIARSLSVPLQRLAAAGALALFLAIVLAIELPMVLESLRLGRRLEMRFRMALLRKLPRLNDRYFQSRPITDMADRSHNIHLVRSVPTLGLQLIQGVVELGLTVVGVAWVDPAAAWLAALLALVAMVFPLLVQPMLNERDLRVRNHAGALHGFYLDALLGLAPVRAHRAERAVSRRHESLMVEWAQSFQGWIRMALVSDGAQALIGALLGGGLLLSHFLRERNVGGSDLLLAYWVLKLPAIGSRLAGLAHQYPAQRNALLRLMEPLNAPEPLEGPAPQPGSQRICDAAAPLSIELADASVLAGGHPILREVNLTIAAGEHVAVVGVSGAGKSSLLGLLLGWHRLSSGALRLGGREADSGMVESLRRRCAWVDPGVQVWNRSLIANLQYACEDDGLDRIAPVIEAARLRGVAQSLPRGLQTLLGEGGGLLSGGEGQRVRLGRALMLQSPHIALLDEPFRGLDRSQRRSLLAEARSWWRDTTLICVTHDVGETLTFGRVLVMEDGRVVEDGRPAELAARASRYRDLLDAESNVRDGLWRDGAWRRLRVEHGLVAEAVGP